MTVFILLFTAVFYIFKKKDSDIGETLIDILFRLVIFKLQDADFM